MNEIVKKNGVMFGILMGVFSILTTTIIYAVNIELFASMWLGIVLLLVYLVFYIVAMSKTKKQLNGVMTFKQGFTVFFIMAVIGMTISVLFNFLLFNVIDPQAKDTLKDITIKSTTEMMERFGAPEEQMDATLAELEKTDNYSLANLAKGWVFGLLFSCLLGLILALIFRSRPAYKD